MANLTKVTIKKEIQRLAPIVILYVDQRFVFLMVAPSLNIYQIKERTNCSARGPGL